MNASAPEILPLLSRGKHRRPKDGACFMEMASVLAGERWSDHPSCTHPLLARLARLVNDLTSDDSRSRLAPLIPSVIGLNSRDRRWDDELTLLAATTALPLVGPWDQRSLAAGVLTADALLAERDGRRPGQLRAESAAALATAPEATAWARSFVAILGGPRGRRHPGAAVVDFSVHGMAGSGRSWADGDLRKLLEAAISLCERLAAQETETVPVAGEPKRAPRSRKGFSTAA